MASEPLRPPRFFALHEGGVGGRHEAHCHKVEPVRGDAPQCPRCGLPTGSLEWLPPFRVKLELFGESLGDFIRETGDGFLVSERFAEAFHQEGLTGFSDFHPVEVVRAVRRPRSHKPFQVPRYLYACAGFSHTSVDVVRSHFHRDKPFTCDWCRQSLLHGIQGFFIEEGSWTGEDVFRPRGLAGINVVSERFADFVQRHGFTNMLLIPTEQYLFPRSSSLHTVH